MQLMPFAEPCNNFSPNGSPVLNIEFSEIVAQNRAIESEGVVGDEVNLAVASIIHFVQEVDKILKDLLGLFNILHGYPMFAENSILFGEAVHLAGSRLDGCCGHYIALKSSLRYLCSIGRVDSNRPNADDIAVSETSRFKIEEYTAKSTNTSNYGAHVQSAHTHTERNSLY